jgi:subtilisin-like proprotein convertase family protein
MGILWGVGFTEQRLMTAATLLQKVSSSAAVMACAAGMVAGLTAVPARAASFTGLGTFSTSTIPDNNSTGIFSNITVDPNLFNSSELTNITVTLTSLNHDYAGDLIATLTYLPKNQTVSLFNRIGRTVTGRGDNSNFSSTSTLTYSFSDAFTGNLWTAAAPPTGGGTNFNIPVGNYKPTGAGSSTPISLLDVFKTSPGTGDWQLRISDNATSNGAANRGTGSISGWSLKLEGRDAPKVKEIPEPSSVLGLLALGLLGVGAAAANRKSNEGKK